MSANETPRTDSAAVTQNLSWGQIGMVPADFARTLERELAEANHKHEISRSQIRVMAADLEGKRARLLLADRMAEALEKIAKQRPSKPDYWSTCGQCEHNSEDASEALLAYRAAKETKLP